MRAALVGAIAFALAACAARDPGAARGTTLLALEVSPGWLLSPAPVLRQRGPRDGGSTALAMVAARWGVDPAEASAAASAAPGGDVSITALRTAARSLGLYAFALSADTSLLVHEVRRGRPVVIALAGRYEVVAGINLDAGLIATIDPGAGWRLRTFRELELEWAPAQHPALLVRGVAPDQAVSDDPSALASRASSRR